MATALVMMTDPGNPEANGRMVHLLKAADALREAGDEVGVYLRGAGVNWATAFAVREDNFTKHYGELFDRVKPLIGGACLRRSLSWASESWEPTERTTPWQRSSRATPNS